MRWTADQWGSGFTASVAVTNLGTARTSWALAFTFPGNQQVTNAWNTTVSQSGAAVTARNTSWNGALATGATVTFGLQATYSGVNARPTDLRLDGVNCTISG
ncbi:cellulose binding domain-containing protein [Actinoplanes xinjiangensis]|uniref:cellulose binding domain-containing protein n=1 Tax=Actinoplanes xinjiangensis TaxID=512350 RepID=UPI0035A2532B